MTKPHTINPSLTDPPLRFVLKAAIRFLLIAPINLSPIDAIPAGETGLLDRYDENHIQLTFDRPQRPLFFWNSHSTLILDLHDTAPEYWQAIKLDSLGELCNRTATEPNIYAT